MKLIFVLLLAVLSIYLMFEFLKDRFFSKPFCKKDEGKLIDIKSTNMSNEVGKSIVKTTRNMKKLDLSKWYSTINQNPQTLTDNEELFEALKRNQFIDTSLYESLKVLLTKSILHYKNFEKYEFIPKPSLPILFFGDIEAYSRERFKVLTAALNPSDIEFRESKNDKNFSLFRFPFYSETSGTLYLSLKDYFINTPYIRWFDSSYKQLLQGLGYSFYSDELKTAVHTDIVSPLSTNPTWSKLKSIKQFKNEIQEIEQIGLDLWIELVEIIKPNLILMSLAKGHLSKLNLEFISEFDIQNITQGNKKRKRPYITNLYKLNLKDHSCFLIHSPSGTNPFRLISNSDQRLLGEKIRRNLIENKKGSSFRKRSDAIDSSFSHPKTEIRKNFILSKNLMGKGALIQIGEGKDKIVYDHDQLLNDLGDRITKLPCWSKYGYYTKTGGDLPKFCKGRDAIIDGYLT